jgi:hypothetical protein
MHDRYHPLSTPQTRFGTVICTFNETGEAMDKKSTFPDLGSGSPDRLRPANDHHEQGDIDAE